MKPHQRPLVWLSPHKTLPPYKLCYLFFVYWLNPSPGIYHGWAKSQTLKWHSSSKSCTFFCMLPVNEPLYYMRILQQCFSHFIWGRAHPKLPRPTIILPKIWSGMGLPHLIHNYHTAQMVQLTKLHSTVQCIYLSKTSSLYTPLPSGTELNIGEIISHPTFLLSFM